MWNPYQPERDLTGVDARTHISRPDTTYDIFDWKNMAAQLVVYRWARSEEFIEKVAIGELHAYLFYNHLEITKRHMGQVIVQATTYNPRKLKGATSDNPKACMTYVWPNRLDLVYGLEWQLAMWVWAMEYKWDELLQNEHRTEIVSEIFDEIASCESDEFEGYFVNPTLAGEFEEKNVNEDMIRKANWPALWAKYGWTDEDWKPGPTERPSLRSV